MDIFTTAGAGDFISITTFVTEEERLSVNRIFYATRAEKLIRQLTPFIFPNLKEEITVCDDFTPSEEINKNPWRPDLVEKFCAHSMQDLITYKFPLKIPLKDFHKAEEWTLKNFFNQVLNKERIYRYPRELMDVSLTRTEDFPFSYYFIHPWSDNQRYEERDLSFHDCEKLIEFISKRKQYALIVNNSSEEFPIKSDWIIDKNKQYNFLQSIEILKKSRLGFLGTASIFSVIASKKFAAHDMHIKAASTMLNDWYKFYYAPHTKAHFIYQNLDHLI